MTLQYEMQLLDELPSKLTEVIPCRMNSGRNGLNGFFSGNSDIWSKHSDLAHVSWKIFFLQGVNFLRPAWRRLN
jgi:hypothetical protein